MGAPLDDGRAARRVAAMMDFAKEAEIRGIFALTRSELRDRMKQGELAQGFTVVESAKWFDPDDWQSPLISQDNRRVRLVLLEAKKPHTGQFTKLIGEIEKAGLVPVVVEPNTELVAWCKRHFYRKRNVGRGEFRHEVWYPKRCAY